MKCGCRIGDQYWGDKAQGQFCLVDLRVKNVSDDPIYYLKKIRPWLTPKARPTRLTMRRGFTWIPDLLGEINPGNTLKTTVPFDISERAKLDYLLLKAGVWGFSICTGQAVTRQH